MATKYNHVRVCTNVVRDHSYKDFLTRILVVQKFHNMRVSKF